MYKSIIEVLHDRKIYHFERDMPVYDLLKIVERLFRIRFKQPYINPCTMIETKYTLPVRHRDRR